MAKGCASITRTMVVIAGGFLPALFSAHLPEGKGDESPGDEPAAIVGRWRATERHEAFGALYQPVHAARKREALVYFEQDGGRLTGRSETAGYKEITGQGDWDGRTRFDRIRFEERTLLFEIDITDWNPKMTPLSEGLTSREHKGTIRVEARLNGDRLAGKWGVFTKDGVEIFRGEWEAVRANQRDEN
jgi:hypothetical protein